MSFAVAFAIACGASVACNLITGAPERVLDEPATSPKRDGGLDVLASQDAEPSSPTPSDGSADLDAGDGSPGVVTITVSRSFISPNGAQFTTTSQGTQITGFTTFNHPVITPAPQPAISSQDYTVTATVRVQEASEFGLLARGQADGSAVTFGSMYGATPRAFLGTVSPTDWNPVLSAQQPTAYTFAANSTYLLSMKVQGTQVWGKMWESTASTIPDWQVTAIAPWSTGTSIGFYVYGTTTPILENIVVTVP